jgi:hypothetical protein
LINLALSQYNGSRNAVPYNLELEKAAEGSDAARHALIHLMKEKFTFSGRKSYNVRDTSESGILVVK